MDKRKIPVVRGEQLRPLIDAVGSVALIERAPSETAAPDRTDCTVPLAPSQESLSSDSSDAPWGP